MFDRTGPPGGREELVFKEMMFIWVTKNKFTSIKQIHGDEHPFVRMYGTRVNGQRAFDLAKMVRDNFDFCDSKACWQLQLADMLASAWVNALRDHNNTRGTKWLPLKSQRERNRLLRNSLITNRTTWRNPRQIKDGEGGRLQCCLGTVFLLFASTVGFG